MQKLQEHIIKEFGSPKAQEFYIAKATAGLWKSEEILLKKYLAPDAKVLDIGCGTGRTTIPLHLMGYSVVGIDITPEMVASAKRIAREKELQISYEVGDATHLRFPDESFDATLFSNNGWTQIPERKRRALALREVFRVLRSSGVFIFTTHVRQWRGFFFFWLTQWIKLYVLKPFGFSVDEEEWGDRFFNKETSAKSDIPHYDRQYIHIPSVTEVRRDIARAGFALEFTARASKISGEVRKYSPMFYVCRKP